ncbi:MAG: hypothetical protein G01um101425_946 [Candidatus Peregrinibacteria bacterium Gr01-1014_25]|nr:MAG: hypothetical protein G01um101425_946 [Candidatus Peregrinibacteria bacterium Gr01-1014_25]
MPDVAFPIGLALLFVHLHWFFGVAALLGVILFLVWAIRTLNGPGMKRWALWFMIIGVIGSLVTAPLAAPGFFWFASLLRGKTMDMAPMMKGGMMFNDADDRRLPPR